MKVTRRRQQLLNPVCTRVRHDECGNCVFLRWGFQVPVTMYAQMIVNGVKQSKTTPCQLRRHRPLQHRLQDQGCQRPACLGEGGYCSSDPCDRKRLLQEAHKRLCTWVQKLGMDQWRSTTETGHRSGGCQGLFRCTDSMFSCSLLSQLHLSSSTCVLALGFVVGR